MNLQHSRMLIYHCTHALTNDESVDTEIWYDIMLLTFKIQDILDPCRHPTGLLLLLGDGSYFSNYRWQHCTLVMAQCWHDSGMPERPILGDGSYFQIIDGSTVLWLWLNAGMIPACQNDLYRCHCSQCRFARMDPEPIQNQPWFWLNAGTIPACQNDLYRCHCSKCWFARTGPELKRCLLASISEIQAITNLPESCQYWPNAG